VDRNTIVRLFNGEKFTSETVEKIAKALDCNPIDLMVTEGFPDPHLGASAFAMNSLAA
jgi:DNA-binding Xre family transcriptional regulator